jgi:hypothetical protein
MRTLEPITLAAPSLLGCCLLLSGAIGGGLSGDEVLARSAENEARRHALLREYSGMRNYTVTNRRFGREAADTVQMSYLAGEGARFKVLSSSGSDKLAHVIDRVLVSEQEASRAPENALHEITPANYSARLAGIESLNGQSCYVLSLLPRASSKYLIKGKAWIHRGNFALMRIEGQFAASVSVFLGRPYFTQEFGEVAGFWLPTHARATSSTFLLGVSELDIVYRDYQVTAASTATP